MVVEQNAQYQLEQLFEAHYAALLLYGVSMVKDQDDAKDIVQKAFIQLWQKKDSLDFHTSARAYLYKSVYHASLDLLKHKKIRRRYEDETKGREPAIFAINSEEKELHARIEVAISSLPGQCQKIFKMSRYDGLRYKEIATTLGISEKTVENQMSKALKILREALANYLTAVLLLLILL